MDYIPENIAQLAGEVERVCDADADYTIDFQAINSPGNAWVLPIIYAGRADNDWDAYSYSAFADILESIKNGEGNEVETVQMELHTPDSTWELIGWLNSDPNRSVWVDDALGVGPDTLETLLGIAYTDWKARTFDLVLQELQRQVERSAA